MTMANIITIIIAIITAAITSALTTLVLMRFTDNEKTVDHPMIDILPKKPNIVRVIQLDDDGKIIEL